MVWIIKIKYHVTHTKYDQMTINNQNMNYLQNEF